MIGVEHFAKILAKLSALIPVALMLTDHLWHSAVHFVDIEFAALFGLILVLILDQQATTQLGFNLTPQRGWAYWIRFNLKLVGLMGLILGTFALVAWLTQFRVNIPKTDPQWLLQRTYWMVLVAPVIEELLFRSLLCYALNDICSFRVTIFVSGSLFAAAHWSSGNTSPENQLAGFFLAYAFLKSSSITVPVAMHAAGNLVALAGQVAAWYWLTGS